MTGKSSALIMRQMHPIMVNDAEKYDLLIDFPSWFSTLSISEDAVPYTLQKLYESEFLIKLSDKKYHNKEDEVKVLMGDILNTFEIYELHSQEIICSKRKGRKSNY